MPMHRIAELYYTVLKVLYLLTTLIHKIGLWPFTGVPIYMLVSALVPRLAFECMSTSSATFQ